MEGIVMSRRERSGSGFLVWACIVALASTPSWGASIVSLGELDGGEFTEGFHHVEGWVPSSW